MMESLGMRTQGHPSATSAVMMTMMVAGSRAQMVALSLVHRHRKESPPAP